MQGYFYWQISAKAVDVIIKTASTATMLFFISITKHANG
jgi:hypothetical protein